jgi:hypothetical protein
MSDLLASDLDLTSPEASAVADQYGRMEQIMASISTGPAGQAAISASEECAGASSVSAVEVYTLDSNSSLLPVLEATRRDCAVARTMATSESFREEHERLGGAGGGSADLPVFQQMCRELMCADSLPDRFDVAHEMSVVLRHRHALGLAAAGTVNLVRWILHDLHRFLVPPGGYRVGSSSQPSSAAARGAGLLTIGTGTVGSGSSGSSVSGLGGASSAPGSRAPSPTGWMLSSSAGVSGTAAGPGSRPGSPQMQRAASSRLAAQASASIGVRYSRRDELDYVAVLLELVVSMLARHDMRERFAASLANISGGLELLVSLMCTLPGSLEEIVGRQGDGGTTLVQEVLDLQMRTLAQILQPLWSSLCGGGHTGRASAFIEEHLGRLRAELFPATVRRMLAMLLRLSRRSAEAASMAEMVTLFSYLAVLRMLTGHRGSVEDVLRVSFADECRCGVMTMMTGMMRMCMMDDGEHDNECRRMVCLLTHVRRAGWC